MSSLTFVYEDSTAVLGPLSRVSEPHAYDLCREHAAGINRAARLGNLLRVAGGEEVSDDLLALADAVRPPRATPPSSPAAASSAATRPSGASGAAHRARENAETGPRHLHVLRGSDD